MTHAQFQLYKNRHPKARAAYPLLVNLQNDLMSALQTRLIAPLAKATGLKQPMSEVTPTVRVDDVDYVVVIPLMAALSRSELGAPIGSLSHYRTELVRAIDQLITGI